MLHVTCNQHEEVVVISPERLHLSLCVKVFGGAAGALAAMTVLSALMGWAAPTLVSHLMQCLHAAFLMSTTEMQSHCQRMQLMAQAVLMHAVQVHAAWCIPVYRYHSAHAVLMHAVWMHAAWCVPVCQHHSAHAVLTHVVLMHAVWMHLP